MASIKQVSPAMQRYAAEVFRIQQDTPQVSLSTLAEQVESSPQAIARMVRRLTDAGYATYEPYRGVRLTEAGQRIAMPALRRHRLSEVFLVKVMGYDWAAAHELTDTFERGINQELEDKMDEMAGHPTRCPHGEPIPSSEGVITIPKDAPLVEQEAGAACLLSRVRTHNMDKLRYIGNLGLVPGVEFTLVSQAPFNGPLRLQFERNEQVIGFELANSLWVETK